MSWHIWVAIRKNPPAGGWNTRIYVHIFDELASQDSAAAVATLKDTLTRIRAECLWITKAFVRSNNAGCYHSATTLASIIQLNKELPIKVMRWDFSEPQQGKDACDHYTAVVKRKVWQYVVGNKKCQTPIEFQMAAVSDGGSPGVSIIRGRLGTINGPEIKPKIEGISFLNNFEFNVDSTI